MTTQSITNHNLFVITGGPGAGKTTVLLELERRGFRHAPEVARQIIQEQVRTNGDAVPWGNTARYTELMLEQSIASFLAHTPAGDITFVDRGIPDVLCYAGIIRLLDTANIESSCAAYRYNKRVFIAPPWEEIYETDSERKQTFEEAIDTYYRLPAVYVQCRYELVELPKVSPEERADFILADIGVPG